MLVTIVAVPNADNTGLDLDRLEKVEDLPDEVGRKMLDIGTAREPSEDELGKYREAQDEKPDTYDNGGVLPVGVTQVQNDTGQDELIANPVPATRTAKKPGETPTGAAPTGSAEAA